MPGVYDSAGLDREVAIKISAAFYHLPTSLALRYYNAKHSRGRDGAVIQEEHQPHSRLDQTQLYNAFIVYGAV